MNYYDKLFTQLNKYNKDIEIISKAYDYAFSCHEHQLRDSGEPYIIHPLHVAYYLSLMNADTDTIIAALLHDTLEDTKATKEEIISLFKEEVYNLVDGLTNIKDLKMNDKNILEAINSRKVLTSVLSDPRIMIIKLCDNLHNISTLKYKKKEKQKKQAIRTLEVFVPFAYSIGAYDLKNKLADEAFKYLKPVEYSDLKNDIKKMYLKNEEKLKDIKINIFNKLKENNIKSKITINTNTIYNVYNELDNSTLKSMHNLFVVKILVDNIEDCYKTLMVVHSLFLPYNEHFKDYIAHPKNNKYSSIHSTIFIKGGQLVQIQIRTKDMELINMGGLTSYWKLYKNAKEKMKHDLKNNYQFYKIMNEMDDMTSDNQEFINDIKNELFGNKIVVYTRSGDFVELPNGSTPIDFAYKIHTDIGDNMVSAVVNNEIVSLDYQLKNYDTVRIITDETVYVSKEDWFNIAKTSLARKKILNFIKKNE